MNSQIEATDAIQPHLLARLAEQAHRTGNSLNELIVRLLDENEGEMAQERPLYETLPPAELAEAFAQWIHSHDPQTPIILNDSRDALYEDDGR